MFNQTIKLFCLNYCASKARFNFKKKKIKLKFQGENFFGVLRRPASVSRERAKTDPIAIPGSFLEFQKLEDQFATPSFDGRNKRFFASGWKMH